MSKKDRVKGGYHEPETLFDTHRPAGPPQAREYTSQTAQLESEVRHGTRKDVKRQMSYKTGLGEWEEKERRWPAHREGLEGRVQQFLDEDKNLRGYGLKAEAVGDRIVVSGVVDTLAEKEYAEEALRRLAEGKAVESAIALSTDGAVRDEDLTAEVAEELAATPGVDTRRVGATVRGGTVILHGRPADEAEARAAARAAARAKGVTRVVSHLRRTDRPEETSLEDLFHSQVRNDGD